MIDNNLVVGGDTAMPDRREVVYVSLYNGALMPPCWKDNNLPRNQFNYKEQRKTGKSR